MIVSASRRTDIPAYYSDWLMGRIEAGYCLVASPYDARRLTRVSLKPEDLDFLVLWTRDPRPMTRRLSELDAHGIRSYVQVTVIGYPAAIEPGAPPLDEAIDALRDLSETIGRRRVVWRYDPIVLAGALGPAFHVRNFGRIAARLEGAVERVVVSLLDEYARTAPRLEAAGFPPSCFGTSKGGRRPSAAPPEPYPALLSELSGIARSRGMEILACAEPYDLSGLGIGPSACVDASLAASLWGAGAASFAGAAAKDSGQRGPCRCAKSVDIGAYGTCPRGCAYCYANRGQGRLRPRGREDERL